MADPEQPGREKIDAMLIAAGRFRANLDTAVYKHAVLGLIFLKYVSDSFAIRQIEFETQVRNSDKSSKKPN